MILGSYPCCDGSLAIEVPGDAPVYFTEACPHCGAAVWHRLSRSDPESWTEEEFWHRYEIIDGEVVEKLCRSPFVSFALALAPDAATQAVDAFQRYFQRARRLGVTVDEAKRVLNEEMNLAHGPKEATEAAWRRLDREET